MREWRNQSANREVSNQRHVISPEEHAAWWERTSKDSTREVLVLEIDGQPCGVVSFFDLELDGSPKTGGWGFYLDHDGLEQSGATLIAWNKVMKEAVDHAFDDLGLDVLTAEVLAHNEAVRVTNRRFRFVEGTPETKEVDGREITVIPISLRREDRRGARKGS